MRCLITCGPTYESLDQVRRLTNFSTGQLGIGLANHLQSAGHEITLFKGYYATCADPCNVRPVTFTTTDDLFANFRSAADEGFDAIFHAAAVSDFRFGTTYMRLPNGSLKPISSRKFSTRDGNLFAELVPTPKIISHLRVLFPSAKIFGWKYEVEGSRDDAIALGLKQVRENKTNFSIVNGPAYGRGFGVVNTNELMKHCTVAADLYAFLLQLSAN